MNRLVEEALKANLSLALRRGQPAAGPGAAGHRRAGACGRPPPHRRLPTAVRPVYGTRGTPRNIYLATWTRPGSSTYSAASAGTWNRQAPTSGRRRKPEGRPGEPHRRGGPRLCAAPGIPAGDRHGAQNNLKVQPQTADITRKLYKAGSTAAWTWRTRKAYVASTEAQIPVYETGARQSIYALSVLLGRHPETSWSICHPRAICPPCRQTSRGAALRPAPAPARYPQAEAQLSQRHRADRRGDRPAFSSVLPHGRGELAERHVEHVGPEASRSLFIGPAAPGPSSRAAPSFPTSTRRRPSATRPLLRMSRLC